MPLSGFPGIGNQRIPLKTSRWHDVYLLCAEALVRQGKQPGVALTYFNKVRQRTRNSTRGGLGILPDYNPFGQDAEFLLAIQKECRLELAFEPTAGSICSEPGGPKP